MIGSIERKKKKIGIATDEDNTQTIRIRDKKDTLYSQV